MKYDILYNWISPLTGKIADFTQLPDLPTGKTWVGDISNRPVPTIITPISNTLKEDYTFIGDTTDVAKESPIIIDIRLDLIDVKRAINSITAKDTDNATYILQTPNVDLPNAQNLKALGGGILKATSNGVVEKAIVDSDYMGGIASSLPNSIIVFADQYGKKVKQAGGDTNPAIIDDSGNVKAQGLLVRDSINTTTGFIAPYLSDGSIYSLPATGGFITQVLAILALPVAGITPTFWMTIPQQFTREPENPNDPFIPIWIPNPDGLPTPIMEPTTPGIPNSVPVLNTPGSGQATDTPTTIDPTTGDVTTPGGLSTGGAAAGAGIAAGAGSIAAAGGIAAGGGTAAAGGIAAGAGAVAGAGSIAAANDVTAGGKVISTEVITTTTTSTHIKAKDTSTDTLSLTNPTDPTKKVDIKVSDTLTDPYVIIYPPTPGTEGQVIVKGPGDTWIWEDAPSGQTITITPDIGIKVTPDTPTDYKIGLDDSGVIPGNYFIPVEDIDKYGRVTAVRPPDESELIDLVFNSFTQLPSEFGGNSSNSRNYPFYVKTSYYITPGDFSSASLNIFNRNDNGYILKTLTQYGQNPNFFFQLKLGNTITDLYEYDATNNNFLYLKSIDMNGYSLTGLTVPINPLDAANKAYVDSHIISGVTLVSSGNSINITGTTSNPIVNVANSGVTPGDYTNSNVRVNAQGIITLISNGSSAGIILNPGIGINIAGTTSSPIINIANTTVTAASYRFCNPTFNAQGQATAATNGSPASTTINTIPVWGNITGTSLINTAVNIDTNNNITGINDITSSGIARSLVHMVSDAAGSGALAFLAGNKTLNIKLANIPSGNLSWSLPITNSNGYFKNDGLGNITWSTIAPTTITLTGAVTGSGTTSIVTTLTNITTSQISNFNSSVIAFTLDQFTIPTSNINLNNKNITNLADPINAQDALTLNYFNTHSVSPNTGDITFSANVISAVNVNEDVIITPKGLGKVQLWNVVAFQNILTTTSPNTVPLVFSVQTVNFNCNIVGQSTSSASFANVLISSNTISTTTTNLDLNINPNGTGKINLTGDIVGDISNTVSLGGIAILGNNIISRTVNTDISIAHNGTGNVNIDNVKFNNNNISSYNTNSDLNISANGTGIVNIQPNSRISNIYIADTEIYPTGVNDDLTLRVNGGGTGVISVIGQMNITRDILMTNSGGNYGRIFMLPNSTALPPSIIGPYLCVNALHQLCYINGNGITIIAGIPY